MTDTDTHIVERSPIRFDDAAKERVINFVRSSGYYPGLMAKVASVSRETIRLYMKEDPVFKAAIDDALEERNAELETEARRRAVEGVTRRKYDKDGNLLEEEQVYSDRLMERLLEADIEKFKSKNPFAKDGGVGGVLLIPVIPAEKAVSIEDLSARLEKLSVTQRSLEETEGGTKE